MFVSMAIASIISSIFLIIGASVLLLSINWRLALAILGIVPFIGITFQLVLRKVRELFKKGQEAIDWLNRVISESILGAALIRLLNTQHLEYEKFLAANTEARDIGLSSSILRLFASLIPAITLATNIATVVILALGGQFVIAGSMTLGDFTAFNSYLAILIFPIILLGFMSNVIAQAGASYVRIGMILAAPEEPKGGRVISQLHGDVTVDTVTLAFGDKAVLKNVSIAVPAGTRNRHHWTHRGRKNTAPLSADRPAATCFRHRRLRRRVDRLLRQGIPAPACRLQCLPGQRHVQPEPAREHRFQ